MAGRNENAIINHWSQIWPSWHAAKAKKHGHQTSIFGCKYFWVWLKSINTTQPVFHIHDIQPAGKGKTCIGCYLCWVCHRQIHHVVRACVSHDALLQKSEKQEDEEREQLIKDEDPRVFRLTNIRWWLMMCENKWKGPKKQTSFHLQRNVRARQPIKLFPRRMIMCIQIFPFWPFDTFLRMTERRRERKSPQRGFKKRMLKFTRLKFRMKKKKTLRCISKLAV